MRINQNAFQQDPWKNPGFWIGVLLIFLLLAGMNKCSAQTRQVHVYDTIPADIRCVKDFIVKNTASGKERVFALYKDSSIQEIIPISESAYDYIKVCKKYDVTARIGIRLRDGKIQSLIRIPLRYDSKRRRYY